MPSTKDDTADRSETREPRDRIDAEDMWPLESAVDDFILPMPSPPSSSCIICRKDLRVLIDSEKKRMALSISPLCSNWYRPNS